MKLLALDELKRHPFFCSYTFNKKYSIIMFFIPIIQFTQHQIGSIPISQLKKIIEYFAEVEEKPTNNLWLILAQIVETVSNPLK